MKKREKRTCTWCGVGNLLSLKIDGRAHDVRISGNRQKHRDDEVDVRSVSVRLRESGGKVRVRMTADTRRN
jgi:hypothetical protein